MRSSRQDLFADRLERTIGERALSVERNRREVTREPIENEDDLDDPRAQVEADEDNERRRPTSNREPDRGADPRGQGSLHDRVLAMLERTREQEVEAASHKSRSNTRDDAARTPDASISTTVEGQARGLLRRRG
jgi:hypothetical protein